ncbi:MAG: hypothetical protein KatS3mg052_0554 [Candidatus Roseilinea sp.]|nr:MAG: hypothetical protein KatS3mg052_0554 [Candidatus Roseilinea sp.]
MSNTFHTTLRRVLRNVGQRLPGLRRLSGRLGLGRLLSAGSTQEQIIIDEDIVIELDLSVPIFRYIYFHHNLSEAVETKLIRRLANPTDSYVDVGAHIGYFALVAAKYAGRTHAFEPSAKTFTYLRRNLDLNPMLARKIFAHQIGLGSAPATLKLYRPASHPGTASLQPVSAPDTIIETIEVDTLDNCIGAEKVHFIKADVEGGELDVFRGAQGIIERDRPCILCEMFEPHANRFGYTCGDLMAFFVQRRYQGFLAGDQPKHSSKITLANLDLQMLSKTEANNALFIPVEKKDSILARLTS